MYTCFNERERERERERGERERERECEKNITLDEAFIKFMKKLLEYDCV
jgi:hypothetical protein